jgi:seryl-tRNA synthetase
MLWMLSVLKLLWAILLLEETNDDDDIPPDDDDESHDDDPPDDDDDEDIRDPKAKIAALKDEKERHKRNAKKAREDLDKANQRIKQLEDGGATDGDGESRIEAAFWKSLVVGPHKIADHESALDLFTARGFIDLVTVGDDGEVAGMDEAMEKMLARYPWLADDDLPTDDDADTPPKRRTASPPRKKKDSQPVQTRADLEKRLPHLRKHQARAKG